MARDRCPGCGTKLVDPHMDAERCPACGRELRPSDEDRPITPSEASEEASKDSFPASDPPAW